MCPYGHGRARKYEVPEMDKEISMRVEREFIMLLHFCLDKVVYQERACASRECQLRLVVNFG